MVGQLKKEIGNWGQRLTFDKLRPTLIEAFEIKGCLFFILNPSVG
jgi:hypothetical protein